MSLLLRRRSFVLGSAATGLASGVRRAIRSNRPLTPIRLSGRSQASARFLTHLPNRHRVTSQISAGSLNHRKAYNASISRQSPRMSVRLR